MLVAGAPDAGRSPERDDAHVNVNVGFESARDPRNAPDDLDDLDAHDLLSSLVRVLDVSSEREGGELGGDGRAGGDVARAGDNVPPPTKYSPTAAHDLLSSLVRHERVILRI